MKEYDKIFKRGETKEKQYPLASGYISTTTVFFEEENIVARIEAKGDVAFFDGGAADDASPIATVNMPVQTGGREVYEDVVCSVEGDEMILKFPIVKWIDHYPHCDGEHDRWDSVIIGWHTLTFDMKTREYSIVTE